jgi:DNA polymerase-4
MVMARTIIHMDLDAFFCSVEELHDPTLRGKPFVVGGTAEGRGVISSASYPARKYGIRSAMPTAQALRLCPGLIVISGHRRHYSRYSNEVMKLLRLSAPTIQRISIDEAFVDLGKEFGKGESTARTLQRQIKDQVGLPSSWGIASNKLVAKIASDVGKPEGIVVVTLGEERQFLAPLPAQMLWGVGPKTFERLHAIGIRTIGDLAAVEQGRLRPILGDRSAELIRRAKGEDDRPVVEGHEPKSMSAERTFSTDQAERAILEATLLHLSEEVGRRLRAGEYAGSTVKVKLRWPNFTTLTRQLKTGQPVSLDDEIYTSALTLFHQVWKPGKAVRLLGVGVADLGPPIRQLELFDRSWQQDGRLLEAVDEIRQKYGSESLRRGSDWTRKGPTKGASRRH